VSHIHLVVMCFAAALPSLCWMAYQAGRALARWHHRRRAEFLRRVEAMMPKQDPEDGPA